MMQSLTSSYSKAIIDKHKDGGFSWFKDLSLNKAELRLFPSKDLVGIRFLHLLSLQHRRLQPVLSSSSFSPDSQVNLETVETQPEQEIPSKTINVKFQLEKECSFGEHFFMVGDHPMLGLWDPESAIPLTWSEGHVWTAELDIPVGTSIQFKFILKTSTGELLWQPDPDRVFESNETEHTVVVCEDWEEAENQVIKEQPIANQDEPLLDSETAIVAENLTPPKEEDLVPDQDGPLLDSETDIIADNSIPPKEKELVPDINLTSTEKEQLQALSEELATGNGELSLEKPLAIVAENISHPIEDLVANAGNGVLGSKTINYPDNEAFNISDKNVMVAEDLGDIDVEANLKAHEGNNPVLVPGLSPLPTVSTEEAMLSVDETNSTNDDASIGVNEALSHELSESEEKQEPEGEPQEEQTTAVAKDEEEQLNQHIQVPLVAEEEQPDLVEPSQSDVLQSDVQWGRKTLKKFLDKLRIL